VSPERDPVAVSDHAGLTDADWLEVNTLRTAYIAGGNPSLSKALEEFCKRNAIAYIRVLNTILPSQIREAIKEPGSALEPFHQALCRVRKWSLVTATILQIGRHFAVR
jgi:hypothetical protein